MKTSKVRPNRGMPSSKKLDTYVVLDRDGVLLREVEAESSALIEKSAGEIVLLKSLWNPVVQRTVKVLWKQDGGEYLVVKIGDVDHLVTKVSEVCYHVVELTRLRSCSYAVWIGNRDSCGCPDGGESKKCVHTDALRALKRAGKI